METEIDFNEWLVWLVMENCSVAAVYCSQLSEKHEGGSFKWMFTHIQYKVRYCLVQLFFIWFSRLKAKLIFCKKS